MILSIAIATSFLVTFILIPIVIKVSRSVDLMDIPDRRKVHRINTPSMGGLGVYVGWVIATLISVSIFELVEYKFLLSGVFLIFILGLRDDISSIKAHHKLMFQILAAVLVVVFGGIRVTPLIQLFGIENSFPVLDQALAVIFIVGLTNAFNLIDGIDGLLGLIGLISSAFLGFTFLAMNQFGLAVLALTFSGSIIAFLFYNWFPSRIFMGDTGSMITGFFISVLFLTFIPLVESAGTFQISYFKSPVAIAIAFMILPIYDTSRVIIIRLTNGISPFVPDRNHIHHTMLNIGFNHAKATLVLISMNLVIISSVILLSEYLSELALIGFEFAAIILFGVIVGQIEKRRSHLGKSGQVGQDPNLFVSKSA